MRGLTITIVVLLAVGSTAWLAMRRPNEPALGPEPPREKLQPREPAHVAAAAVKTARLANEARVSPVRFTTMEHTGIDFVHRSGMTADRYFPCQNGSGLGSIDFDGDGHFDLYFATGNEFGKPPTFSNRLYQNLADWKFREVTLNAGLEMVSHAAGVAVGDIDADGFSDIYVVCVGRNQLFHNQGDGTFVAVPESGTNDQGFGTSAVFFDQDNDGLQDLYVCNYGHWSVESNPECAADDGRNMYCANTAIDPVADVLYRNNGDGTFANVSTQLTAPIARGQGVVAADLNDDDLIDVYVGNDANANTLYTTTNSGDLEDVTNLAGVAYDHRGQHQAGMGVAAADVNRDGSVDLMVTNFEREHNTLYLGQDNRLFEDRSQSAGVVTGAMPWVGWGVAMEDLDLDAWRDLIVVNGHVEPILFETGAGSAYEQPTNLWVNKSGQFHHVSKGAGEYFDRGHPSRALLVSDLDNDGDPDLVIGQMDQAPSFLRNELAMSKPRSIAVRLVGRQTNRDAIGAKLRVVGAVPVLAYQIQGGGSYLTSTDSRVLVAGYGLTNLEVVWPGGRRSMARNLAPGKQYVIAEPTQGRVAVVTAIPD